MGRADGPGGADPAACGRRRPSRCGRRPAVGRVDDEAVHVVHGAATGDRGALQHVVGRAEVAVPADPAVVGGVDVVVDVAPGRPWIAAFALPSGVPMMAAIRSSHPAVGLFGTRLPPGTDSALAFRSGFHVPLGVQVGCPPAARAGRGGRPGTSSTAGSSEQDDTHRGPRPARVSRGSATGAGKPYSAQNWAYHACRPDARHRSKHESFPA